MSPKKNKTLVTVVVLFLAFGLVIAYVPLLFAPSSDEPSQVYFKEQQQEIPVDVPAELPVTAQLTLPVTEPETEVATTTPIEEEISLPDSFSGLEEESESLEDLFDGF